MFHRFQNFLQLSFVFANLIEKAKRKIWREKWTKLGNSIFNREKMLTIFVWNFEIEDRCKGVRGARTRPHPSNPCWVASSRLEPCSLQSLTLPTPPDWGTIVQVLLHRRQVLMAWKFPKTVVPLKIRSFWRPGNYRVMVSPELQFCSGLRIYSLP